MTALTPPERKRHHATTAALFGAVQSVRELADGYAFRLPDETEVVEKTTAFILLERRCCPFLRFTVEGDPAGSAIWLHLTGPDGVKPFLRAELGGALNRAAAGAARWA